MGLLAAPLPRHEIFPFFSWFLFPLTPSEEVSYALKVRQNNGQKIESEGWNQGLLPFKGNNHIDVHYLCQRLGRAYISNDFDEESAAMDILEQQYLKPPYVFDLVRITYHPVRRWKGDEEEVTIVRCYERE